MEGRAGSTRPLPTHQIGGESGYPHTIGFFKGSCIADWQGEGGNHYRAGRQRAHFLSKSHTS